MDNVSFFQMTNSNNEIVDYVLIDRGNGEFTSMTKATYDAQQEAIANGNNL